MTVSRSVIFDLDGTLTDPKPGITRCIAHALVQLGLPSPELDDLTWCIGPPLLGSFKRLLDGDEALALQALALYRERFAEVGLYENAVYDGIAETLGSLRSEGKRLFVATSKPYVYAARILQHFDLSHFFVNIYGSELDGTRTDKGELLAYLLTQEQLSPDESMMVGDREHDILGAQRVGMRGIGVLYGYGTHEELSNAGASALCAQVFDLPKAIAGLSSL